MRALPNGLLIDIRTASGNFNPLYDAQSDVIALVNASGKVERNFRYGPYGENVKSEGTQTISYPFGFKGGYRMPGGNKGVTTVANGLYHFGQRYYDPTAGRWSQQDPIEANTSATAENRFGFAGVDPVNASDPAGLSSASEFYAYGGTSAGAVGLACTVAGAATGGAGYLGCAVGAGGVGLAIGLASVAEEIF